MSEIRKIWEQQETSSDSEVIRQRIISIAGLSAWAGLISYTGARMFQLELPPELPIHRNYTHRFKGVEIQVIPLEEPMVQQFTIILLQPDLTDIFTLFIQDIVDKLESVSDPQEALTLINQRIAFWKKLFARISGEQLSPDQQRGLFGELLVLEGLLRQCERGDTVLQSWRGALSAHQDFALEHHALEVKTSRAGNSVVSIASEHQLDHTNWQTLHLAVIMVNESAGSQRSLAAQITTIQELLQHESTLLDEFHRKLSLVGIPPDAVEQYQEISYTVRSFRYFLVNEGFPAITAAPWQDSPVSAIRYRIDLSACSNHEVSEEEALAHLL